MQIRNDITDISAEMDALYGKTGTPEREKFRKEAYAFYFGKILHDARKIEKITQKELACRIGVDKSYISKIEKGVIEPGIVTFYRITSELGFSIELNRRISL